MIKTGLDQLKLHNFREAAVTNLSAGERKRFQIACCLASNPSVILLDDLLFGIDPLTQDLIWSVFRGLRDKGVSMIFSDDNPDSLKLCDHAYVLYKGRVLAEGKRDVITDNLEYQRLFLNKTGPAPEEALKPDKGGSSTETETIDVFISAKSQDYPLARQVFEFLQAKGLNVFLSLPALGNADYHEEIHQAIGKAKHMVVVASRHKHLESGWVKHEWKTFTNEVLSERKVGNLVILVDSDNPADGLPTALRTYQAFQFQPESFAKILPYFSS
jgi:ABC-type multidrug transport system ATPase subunit